MDEQRVRWINDEATALLAAERDRAPVASLTERRPGMALEDAYRIQAASVARRIAGGAHVIGHKAGVTSKAMQEQMGVNEPDSGVLLDHMVLPSGSSLIRSELMQPRVEAEIAFRLGRDLAGPDVDAETARSAVTGVLLALEVIDTRFTGWQITVADSIADNASCARVVTGSIVPFDPDMDLAGESLVVSVDGTAVATGEGRAVLGDPFRALVWLAHRLSRFDARLHAGDLVLAGAVHASLPLEAASTVRAHAQHLPPVELRVV